MSDNPGLDQIIQDQISQVLSDPGSLPAEFLSFLPQFVAQNPVNSGSLEAPILASTGLVGSTQSSRYVGSTSSGAPTQGAYQVGDFVVDHTGVVWICTAAGSPGTWAAANAPVSSVMGKTGVVTSPFNASITSSSASGGVGYTTGAGANVSGSSGSVTVNAMCGQILIAAQTISAQSTFDVVVTNSSMQAADLVIPNGVNLATGLVVSVRAKGSGTFTMSVANITSGSITTGVLASLAFAIIKASTS